MTSPETITQRRLTREFIKADRVMVSLTRYPKEPSGSGGVVRGTAQTVPPQPMRLVPATINLFQALRHKLEGHIPKEGFLLLALVDADIQPDDEFEFRGGRYQISYVSTERTYETVGSVEYRGQIA